MVHEFMNSVSTLESLLESVNLNINVLISTHDERPLLLKGHFSGAKGVTSYKRLPCLVKGDVNIGKHVVA